MNNRICANCKFYNAPQRECTNPKIHSGSEPETEVDLDGLRYGGYEGYGDYLTVGPLFGCVHFDEVE